MTYNRSMHDHTIILGYCNNFNAGVYIKWNNIIKYSGTSVHERMSSRTNRFTSASHHEQIGSRTPLITNKSVHERLSSRTNRFTNASHHEQIGSRTPLTTKKSVHELIFRKKKSRVKNGVSRVTNTQAGNNGWRQAGSIGGTASVAV
jgi:hypothetical protein